MEKERCQKNVYRGSFRATPCSRAAWRDNYCRQHHPENVAKRKEESQKRWKEEWQNSPKNQLKLARERIAELEAEIEELKRKVVGD